MDIAGFFNWLRTKILPVLVIMLILSLGIVYMDIKKEECTKIIEKNMHIASIYNIQAVDAHVGIVNRFLVAIDKHLSIVEKHQTGAIESYERAIKDYEITSRDSLSEINNSTLEYEKSLSNANIQTKAYNESNDKRDLYNLGGNIFKALLLILNVFLICIRLYPKERPLQEVDWDEEAIQNYNDTT